MHIKKGDGVAPTPQCGLTARKSQANAYVIVTLTT